MKISTKTRNPNPACANKRKPQLSAPFDMAERFPTGVGAERGGRTHVSPKTTFSTKGFSSFSASSAYLLTPGLIPGSLLTNPSGSGGGAFLTPAQDDGSGAVSFFCVCETNAGVMSG